MAYFHVTDAGRSALADHLREIDDPHRGFAVTWNGYTVSVIATTRGEACYRAYLSASESYDLAFGAFMRQARVRVERPTRAAP